MTAPEEHQRADLLRIALIATVAAATWFRLWRPWPQVDLLAIAAMIAGGWPIWCEAAEAVTRRRMTMELSMSIAIFAATIIGESFTALIIVGFVLIAEILEHLTVGRGRKAIGRLVALLPRTALVRRGGSEAEIDVHSISRDDVVIVRPGSRIPVDGEVVHGSSWVDQSAMTGESMPVSRGPAESVFAGTINQSGVLEIRVASVGRETAFGQVIEAVERAEQSRAPVEKIADRLAGYLVYFALACARP